MQAMTRLAVQLGMDFSAIVTSPLPNSSNNIPRTAAPNSSFIGGTLLSPPRNHASRANRNAPDMKRTPTTTLGWMVCTAALMKKYVEPQTIYTKAYEAMIRNCSFFKCSPKAACQPVRPKGGNYVSGFLLE